MNGKRTEMKFTDAPRQTLKEIIAGIEAKCPPFQISSFFLNLDEKDKFNPFNGVTARDFF